MTLNYRNKELDELLKFLEGGNMPTDVPPAEPAPVEGEDPMVQLILAAAQGLQTQDCNLMAQVCQMLVQLALGGAPAAEPQGQPVYKKGGKLSRFI